jgi:hypothetical protein
MDDIFLLFYTNNYFITLRLTMMNKMQKILVVVSVSTSSASRSVFVNQTPEGQ